MSVLIQVQHALGDGDECAVILPGVPGSMCSLVTLQPLGIQSVQMLWNQTLGSLKVHVVGHDMMWATAAQMAPLNLNILLVLPWTLTSRVSQPGQGGGGDEDNSA